MYTNQSRSLYSEVLSFANFLEISVISQTEKSFSFRSDPSGSDRNIGGSISSNGPVGPRFIVAF